ncbi:bifunctional metallophosphatase/5'-nucleotidase [Paraferrimonas haliotis]|uniref:bifunctional metallophosphatase/5'-nucleotidase n=1 Tax=Paraferrimonas haliotis TaxID=2013866 RepID=UPI000BA95642|nr:bifunctional metallophosphatase/5'-nucleotidase [Paraferrimonas haliotis]
MAKNPVYQLALAHINDCHSHFDANRQSLAITLNDTSYRLNTNVGGYAAISAAVQQHFNGHSCPNLFLHGGDCFQGTLYYSVYRGLANAHLLNALQLDAMAIGNHDIDPGNQGLKPFLDELNFPVVAGNLDLSQESPSKTYALNNHPNLLHYDPNEQVALIKRIPFYDTELAIVGVTIEQMHKVATPDPECNFLHAAKVINNTVKQLKSDGINHIVVLSHLGLSHDRDLASAIKGVSFIVGGHSHSLQGNFNHINMDQGLTYGEVINDIPIFHAGKFAECVGLSLLNMDANGKVIDVFGGNQFPLAEPFELTVNNQPLPPSQANSILKRIMALPGLQQVQPDASIEAILEKKYRPKLIQMAQTKVAFASKTLHHTRLPSVGLPQGSEVAPIVAQGFYRSARDLGHRVDFGLHNAGGVRTSLIAGDLSQADIAGRMLPFMINLVVYQIQGNYLSQVLESAIDSAINNGVIGTGTGSFPYGYRIGYHYDASAPSGQRITNLRLYNEQGQWEEVNAEQLYWGVSSAYTASGKEGYQALLNRAQQHSLDIAMAQSFIDLLNHHDLSLLENHFQLQFTGR